MDRWAGEWDAFQKKRRDTAAKDAAEKTRGAYYDVKKTALYIKDLVDKMTLYGRPSGDCFLCRASGSFCLT